MSKPETEVEPILEVVRVKHSRWIRKTGFLMKNIRQVLKGNFIRTAKKILIHKSTLLKKAVRRSIKKEKIAARKSRRELKLIAKNIVIPKPETPMPESPNLDILFETRSIHTPKIRLSKKDQTKTAFYLNPGELYSKKAAIEK